MIRLSIQTSSSNMIPITDFLYLYDLAKCSKCQMFIVLKSTNKLYGASDDCCAIHEIDIPFLVNGDLEFRLDSINKDLIFTHENYFVPNEFPWVILPSYYWEMYIGGDIYADYDSDKDIFNLYDKTTKGYLTGQIQMYKRRVQFDAGRNTFVGQLFGYLNRLPHLHNPYTFTGMEKHPNIRHAFDNKAAMGRILCRLNSDNIDVLLYFYKGLFSLAKTDTLEIDIRFDKLSSSEFMATYRPKKKKNPLTSNKYGIPFSERIHCMYRNLI